MKSSTLDLSGIRCPMITIHIIRAWRKLELPHSLLVTTDDKDAIVDVIAYAKTAGIEVKNRETNGDVNVFTLVKEQ